MSITCPVCKSDQIQTLADRYFCLKSQTFIAMDGTESVDHLLWTSEVPVSAAENADRTTAAFESQ